MIDDRSPVDFALPDDPPETAAERRIELCVDEEAREQRIDLFLVSRFRDASRSAIQRAITGGAITVNEAVVKPSYRLAPGDRIAGEVPAAPPIVALPEAIPLQIVYEDDEIIVVDKPAGMVTHPGAGATSGSGSDSPSPT